MHRGGEDVLATPEDRLRAVPVVRVDVEDRDARQAARAEVLGRDGGVVEVARTAECRPRDMVAGRPAAGVGGGCAVDDEIGGRERGVDSPAGGFPRPLGDDRHRVEAPRARARGEGRRNARLDAAEQAGSREDVSDDVGLARFRRHAIRLPALPRRSQELDEPDVVNRQERVVPMRLCVDDGRPGHLERCANEIGSLGKLVGVDRHADPDGPLRRMAPVSLAPGDRHRNRHGYPAKRYSAATSAVR